MWSILISMRSTIPSCIHRIINHELGMLKGPRGNRCPGKGTKGSLKHVVVTPLKLQQEKSGSYPNRSHLCTYFTDI